MSDAVNAKTFALASGEYAQFRPRYPDALFDWLAGLAPARDFAWDCGTGNGQAAEALARRFARVVANDISAEQIAQAPRPGNIEYLVVPAEEMALPPASVDVLTVAQAFHWFDLARFYPVAHRALKPGGVIAVIGYSFFNVTAPIDAIFGSMLLEPIRPYWSQGNAVLRRGYAEVPFPFDPVGAPPLAISCDWTLDRMLSYIATWSALQRMQRECEAGGAEALLQRARDALAPLWGEGEQRVTMPLHLRVGTNRPN